MGWKCSVRYYLFGIKFRQNGPFSGQCGSLESVYEIDALSPPSARPRADDKCCFFLVAPLIFSLLIESRGKSCRTQTAPFFRQSMPHLLQTEATLFWVEKNNDDKNNKCFVRFLPSLSFARFTFFSFLQSWRCQKPGSCQSIFARRKGAAGTCMLARPLSSACVLKRLQKSFAVIELRRTLLQSAGHSTPFNYAYAALCSALLPSE